MAIKEISQQILKKILTRRAEIEELEKALKTDEDLVFAALKENTKVAHGLFTASIDVKAGRRSTAWKERAIDFVDEARGAGEGQKWADRVIAATKSGDPIEKLVIKISA